MIEKLPDKDTFMPLSVAIKLNELIDAYNELEERYAEHYHLTEDGVGPTTGPSTR